MWILISRFLLIGLGVLIGVALMCLLQVSKQADERMEQMKWRNDE
ncbi:DUF3789 domain-containing protein [Enterococcus gallinarum]|nr:DUF3789 domain-containing protein [Enterococcus gallinarum]TXT68675.1 DUF3789 domain-containing protein [Enterococcus gallinarum]